MDTDWCLTCDRHFDGSGPYCSPDCHTRAGPSSPPSPLFSIASESEQSLQLDDLEDFPRSDSQWFGNSEAGIIAWAAEIPLGALADDHEALTISSAASTTSSTYRPPKLLQPHRPIPPTLCMSTPHPAPSSPSRPKVTPQQQIMAVHPSVNRSEPGSADKLSLLSGATDSSLATPSSVHPVPISANRKYSVLDSIASHVRSWVTPSPLEAKPSELKQRITSAKDAKFAVLAHSRKASAMQLASSSASSLDASDDDAPPVWWVSHASVKPVNKTRPERTRGRQLTLEIPIHLDEHASYRARGRRASRAVA